MLMGYVENVSDKVIRKVMAEQEMVLVLYQSVPPTAACRYIKMKGRPFCVRYGWSRSYNTARQVMNLLLLPILLGLTGRYLP